jgi:putative membrane protein
MNPSLAARGFWPERAGLLAAGLVVLAWSAVRPHDYFTWLLEVAPILIGVPVLVATRRRFPLTPLLYRLLFVPAILAREILLRRGVVRPGGWLFFLVTTVCLAFSALYELIEWWTALLTGSAATAFLGTQGDPWDTQWDMFLALVGALSSQALLGRMHDRQLT